MHVHLGAALLIVVIVAAVLLDVYGWGLVLWPAAILAVLIGAYFVIRRAARLRGRREREALALRRRIAQLEAEQGIPLATEGACAQCGQPLIAGARFCSYCKWPTQRMAQVCERCGTRNAPDAVWCGACGTELPVEDEATTPQRGGFASRAVRNLLEWPPYE